MSLPELDLAAVLIATAVAFLLSGAYYSVVPRPRAAGGDATETMAPWLVVAELLRTLALVMAVAILAGMAGVNGWTQGAVFGIVLWVGFPLLLWAGAILHEDTPWRLAALHGGDWLIKLVVTAVILSI